MKTIIYQVLPRLFGNATSQCVPNGDLSQNGCGKMADFNMAVLRDIRKLGATHVWFTGVIEHATQTSYEAYGIASDHPAMVKGKAGSPYAIKDYYDIDPDLAVKVDARMAEFEALVKRVHAAGLKVIIDFVPNHVARQYHSDNQPDDIGQLGQSDRTDWAFHPDNNFYYIPGLQLQAGFDMRGRAATDYVEMPAKATGNDRFDACPSITDWYETIKLNYGVDYVGGRIGHFNPIPNTWHKMLHILRFWASKKIDGFRCDMAEMVPVEFWEWAIPQVKAVASDLLFIAEVYNPQQYRDYIYRGHFDYLYDKVGLYDALFGIVRGERSAREITWCWQQVGDIMPHMLNFLENHDELRLASDFFASDARKGLPALAVSCLMNTNPFMLYAGQELGERGMDAEGYSGCDGRTTIFDYWTVDTLRRYYVRKGDLTQDERNLRDIYVSVLNMANKEAAFREGLFFDLTYANENNERFNADRQFAFVRKAGDEMILVAVNFDAQAADVCINLPSHLFDYFKMPPFEQRKAKDLLSKQSLKLDMLPYKPVELVIPGYGMRIIKVKA